MSKIGGSTTSKLDGSERAHGAVQCTPCYVLCFKGPTPLECTILFMMSVRLLHDMLEMNVMICMCHTTCLQDNRLREHVWTIRLNRDCPIREWSSLQDSTWIDSYSNNVVEYDTRTALFEPRFDAAKGCRILARLRMQTDGSYHRFHL